MCTNQFVVDAMSIVCRCCILCVRAGDRNAWFSSMLLVLLLIHASIFIFFCLSLVCSRCVLDVSLHHTKHIDRLPFTLNFSFFSLPRSCVESGSVPKRNNVNKSNTHGIDCISVVCVMKSIYSISNCFAFYRCTSYRRRQWMQMNRNWNLPTTRRGGEKRKRKIMLIYLTNRSRSMFIFTLVQVLSLSFSVSIHWITVWIMCTVINFISI